MENTIINDIFSVGDVFFHFLSFLTPITLHTLSCCNKGYFVSIREKRTYTMREVVEDMFRIGSIIFPVCRKLESYSLMCASKYNNMDYLKDSMNTYIPCDAETIIEMSKNAAENGYIQLLQLIHDTVDDTYSETLERIITERGNYDALVWLTKMKSKTYILSVILNCQESLEDYYLIDGECDDTEDDNEWLFLEMCTYEQFLVSQKYYTVSGYNLESAAYNPDLRMFLCYVEGTNIGGQEWPVNSLDILNYLWDKGMYNNISWGETTDSKVIRKMTELRNVASFPLECYVSFSDNPEELLDFIDISGVTFSDVMRIKCPFLLRRYYLKVGKEHIKKEILSINNKYVYPFISIRHHMIFLDFITTLSDLLDFYPFDISCYPVEYREKWMRDGMTSTLRLLIDKLQPHRERNVGLLIWLIRYSRYIASEEECKILDKLSMKLERKGYVNIHQVVKNSLLKGNLKKMRIIARNTGVHIDKNIEYPDYISRRIRRESGFN